MLKQIRRKSEEAARHAGLSNSSQHSETIACYLESRTAAVLAGGIVLAPMLSVAGRGRLELGIGDRPEGPRGGTQQGTIVIVIGVVGLGAAGSGLGGRLLDVGHQVHGGDRTSSHAGALVARGLHWHDALRSVAAAEMAISMVTDYAASEQITGGPDGILSGLAPASVYIDMSGVSPHVSAQLAERVRAVGDRMLDAPVSGSVPQAEQGTLTIMVGGEEETLRRVEPLLRRLGQSPTQVGDNGAGALLKLAISISLAVQVPAFREGLELAERSGIDPQLAANVMAGNPIGSPMLKTRLPLLLDLPDAAWFTIALMHKDIRPAIHQAHQRGVVVPSTAAEDDILATATQLGEVQRDIAGLREVLAKISDKPGA